MTTFAVFLASCATPSAPSPSATSAPIPAPSASSSAPAPIAPPSASAVASSSSPVPSEHDGFISQHWIGGDPDFACSRHAQCYLAPLQKPDAPAAPPFAMCPERKLGMPLEPEYTRKLRKEQGFAACCYLARICKLPLHHD